jgi:hypothetical protein
MNCHDDVETRKLQEHVENMYNLVSEATVARPHKTGFPTSARIEYLQRHPHLGTYPLLALRRSLCVETQKMPEHLAHVDRSTGLACRIVPVRLRPRADDQQLLSQPNIERTKIRPGASHDAARGTHIFFHPQDLPPRQTVIMPYLSHPPLIPPFRYRPRSRSDVTTPPFYIVRSGRSHTVFIMVQTDGTNECKPTKPPSEDAPSPSKFRTRLTGLFTSSKQKDTSPSNTDGVGKSDEGTQDKIPVRILSPRATECVAPSTSSLKRRAFSLRGRLSNRRSISNAPPASVVFPESDSGSESEKGDVVGEGGHVSVTDGPEPETADLVLASKTEKDCVICSGSHIPVTETPYSCEECMDLSAVTSASPTREAALTSHPVFVIEVEGEEKFVTPQTSFMGSA